MELVNSQYTIGGVTIETLQQVAGLPVYVYDAAIIEQQVKKLEAAFSGFPHRIMFAAKALTNVNVLSLLRKYGVGLDTVSIQEVHLGLRAGFLPTEILYTPNMESYSELLEAVNLGVQVNIDAISVLEKFGHDFGGKVPVAVRINPHIMAGGNERISTGHIDSKFGISIHQMRHVQRVVASNGMHINGLHMHTGSDILDADVFLRGAELLLEIAEQFPDIEFLDFGSGFKVPYKPDDIGTDIVLLGQKLSHRIANFNTGRSKPVAIWFEPGKFLVSEAGYFLVQVNVVKQTTATVFAGVDSGMNHLIRPMMYGSHHEIINVSNPLGTPRIYTVVGYICETDTFGWDRKLAEIREGDVLAFRNAGAYGYSMSSNYNARLRPAEILVVDGIPHLIRRRETLDDLLATQVKI